MSQNARMIYLHALSPLHTGTGQAAAIIDLPIAREKATGWPVVPASSLKGVLRAALDPGDGGSRSLFLKAFGPEKQNASEHAGALCFADQRLLCLPVRSFFGTFAYVTCPLALTRFQRDCAAAGLISPLPEDPPRASDGEARIAEGNKLESGGKVYLEDLDLDSRPCEGTTRIATRLAEAIFPESERSPFTSRFAIVSDDVFSFLSETATEVSARVSLKPAEKTVEQGGLWYEEAVPAEALFSGPVIVAAHARGEAEKLLGLLQDTTLQIGGKASVGRGLCRLVVRGGSQE